MNNLNLPSINNLKSLVNQRKVIWHCCTPKSASTFLTLILADLWKDQAIKKTPVPWGQERFQEPDLYRVTQILLSTNNFYYSGHMHTAFTDFFHMHFLECPHSDTGVIVQTRDLKDTVVSIKDHVENTIARKQKSRGPWFTVDEREWKKLTNDEKFLYITLAYSSWHLNFLRSWKRYPKRIEISYKDIIRDTKEVIEDICKFFKISTSKEEVDLAIIYNSIKDSKIKFNAGINGRGLQLLPKKAIDTINELEVLDNKLH